MDLPNITTPLIGQGLNQPIYQPRRTAVAPSRNLLVRISRTKVGYLIGSHTIKYLAGALIGATVILTLSGGAGFGLIFIGLAWWALSTTLSTAALQNKNGKSICLHFTASVFSGAVGFLAGFMSFVYLGELMGGAPQVAMMMLSFSVAPLLMDTLNSMELHGYDIDNLGRGAHTILKNKTLAALNRLFESNEKVTVGWRNDNGETVAIEFNMEGRQDTIVCTPINESTKEWIAVERTLHRYDLFEASSFYDEQGHLRYVQHPFTRQPMRDDMIIRGQPLLDLLRAAE